MKHLKLLLIAIILTACSGYSPPYHTSIDRIHKITVFKTEDNSLLQSITHEDSLVKLIKLLNFNQGSKKKVKGRAGLKLIYTPPDSILGGKKSFKTKYDTTVVILSDDGLYMDVYGYSLNTFGKPKGKKKHKKYILNSSILDYVGVK